MDGIPGVVLVGAGEADSVLGAGLGSALVPGVVPGSVLLSGVVLASVLVSGAGVTSEMVPTTVVVVTGVADGE